MNFVGVHISDDEGHRLSAPRDKQPNADLGRRHNGGKRLRIRLIGRGHAFQHGAARCVWALNGNVLGTVRGTDKHGQWAAESFATPQLHIGWAFPAVIFHLASLPNANSGDFIRQR